LFADLGHGTIRAGKIGDRDRCWRDLTFGYIDAKLGMRDITETDQNKSAITVTNRKNIIIANLFLSFYLPICAVPTQTMSHHYRVKNFGSNPKIKLFHCSYLSKGTGKGRTFKHCANSLIGGNPVCPVGGKSHFIVNLGSQNLSVSI
jgi:hypothetical protein